MKVSSEEMLNIYKQFRTSFQKLHEVVEQENLCIEPIVFSAEPKKVNARSIIDLVNEEFELEVRAKTRRHSVVEARQVAAYLIRKHTTCSYTEIAAYLGVADHTTIMYSVKKCLELMELDRTFKLRVEKLSKELEEYLLNLS